MKIIMAIVSSLDGRLTRAAETDFRQWTSPEEQQEFSKLIAKHNLIVMGAKTYEAARERIKLTTAKLRVILTRDPAKYAAEQLDKQLEFTNQAPNQLVKRLEKLGYKTMLLVGGRVNTLFLEAGLVNEVYWTLEPLILGSGRTLIPDKLLDTKLRLLTSKQLNRRGTLLLHYEVIK